MKFVEEDIFGNEIESDAILRNEFIETRFQSLILAVVNGNIESNYGRKKD